jgi:hypothetical protein
LVSLIPAGFRQDANASEKATFMAFKGIANRPFLGDTHSLSLTDNPYTLACESGLALQLPGKGLVVIET